MSKQLNKRNQGFTIIEVLIVLAIAGIIMLVVFLAVPALQRNSRNTQRRADVASIIGAFNEYVTSNGGSVPGSQANVNTLVANAKLGFFPAANVYYTNAAPAVPASIGGGAGAAGTVTTDNVQIVVGFKCGATTGVVPVAGSTRGAAFIYAVETGGSSAYYCQDGA
jgi:prepilin-type N-terminal cleavage/methylation domain-containing protein